MIQQVHVSLSNRMRKHMRKYMSKPSHNIIMCDNVHTFSVNLHAALLELQALDFQWMVINKRSGEASWKTNHNKTFCFENHIQHRPLKAASAVYRRLCWIRSAVSTLQVVAGVDLSFARVPFWVIEVSSLTWPAPHFSRMLLALFKGITRI